MDDQRSVEDTPASQRLTNDDFRKLLMTPRSTPAGSHPVGSVREAMANAGAMPPPTENKSELRRKKKSYYAALKKQEDNKLAELAEKYRDRARERREGVQDVNPLDPMSNTTSAYRAVAPDAKSGMDAKERRRQMIQESKYLGGDINHTHLVKGLDYALLQKVRSEIQTHELDEEAEMERLVSAPVEVVKEKKETLAEEEMQFETTIGRNIYNMIMEQKNKKIARNELFAPGRMAYVVELEDEGTIDSDIPTTLTRSKADVPELDERSSSSAANEVVIEKLTQIFSYLRHGRHRKQKKKEKGRNDDSIYGDIGDYVGGDRRTEKRDERPRTGYFDKPIETEKETGPGQLARRAPEDKDKRSAALLSRLAAEPEGYAECYPGLREMDDAIDDSDDEVDYSKMDAGNKKGPIGRWDFDTQEEYSAYMSSKEALPKAAFQYGVKTQDGRKTRKTKDKSEKAELDREWQQIQNIIQKRKAPQLSSDEPNFKTPKY
ncbi:protein Red [Pieris brassicae]|uniref:protein Red n=1 Tax=Pieris brassicae TaxID=7116 RepID=UPI001E661F39|nr:protein Red [Pieris brassicae]XP_045523220.1 protein Red [Pieris brassicae]